MAKMLRQIIDDLLIPFMADVRQVPLWIRWSVIVIICVSTIPLAVIFRARTSFSDKPRIHLIQNMDNQPKYVSQEANALFLDGRTMRLRPEGTIAQGAMIDDVHFYMGFVNDAWVTEFPSTVEVNRSLLDRGQDRFNIYCAPCHGLGGFGDGLIHQRALLLVETGINGTTWVAPKNLHDEVIRQQPIGQLFNTITNGVRTMAAYASQIPTKDRWAIVAYIKALQLSQDADPSLVPSVEALLRISASNEGSNK